MKSLIQLLAVFIILTSCGTAKKSRVRQSKINKVINKARSYTGVPYKWGGTSRSGMDCSGLLRVSYQSIGMKIPRSSSEQSTYGKKVSKNDLKPGDWVFFATGKKRKKISHVGLVTVVKNKDVKFIHASSSLGVVESNLSSTYYKKRYRGARRPF